MLAVSTAAFVFGSSLRAASAQNGLVVGGAFPGTMMDTFTVPFTDFDNEPSGCGRSFAGCTGELLQYWHQVAGSITVIDDCTFRIQGWQFDGIGPAVEWCAFPNWQASVKSVVLLLLLNHKSFVTHAIFVIHDEMFLFSQ